MEVLTCRMKEFIQPFERRLALQELRSLTCGPVIPVDGNDATALTFAITNSCNADRLRDALAYWRTVGDADDGLTAQFRSEATSLIARNGTKTDQLPETVRSLVSSCLPKKRCLRYGTHGLHEYRGKFFPQLVRALMNVVQLTEDSIVLDPMSGSGTTLVEAKLSRKHAFGLDMNPLSVFVSDVKCEVLTLQASELVMAYENLRVWLDLPSHRGRGRSTCLSDHDQGYLERWFDLRTLRELDRVEAAIRHLPTRSVQNFYLICLSNILRAVSWQKNDDLRVRREVHELAPGEPIKRFLSEALQSTRVVAAFLAERDSTGMHRHKVLQADARRVVNVFPQLVGLVDAVITSPPYATALPYIDTDRLSLIYLGLLPRDGHRALDTEMIGNREVTTGVRAEYWSFYEQNKALLPQVTRTLIEQIDQLNKNGTVGFRRRNLSALLSKYFFDMQNTMQQMNELLRPGGTMFLVVGNNRTIAGGQKIEIRTADHLGNIAENLGFRMVGRLSMDMLVSRDIFRKNAMTSEQILRLEKPQ